MGKRGLVGVTLVRNGVLLGYPFVPCIKNLLDVCEFVCVSTDTTNDDDTVAVLGSLGPRVVVVAKQWTVSPNSGYELAARANDAVDQARLLGARSFVYLQADEIIDPLEFSAVLDVVDLQRTFVGLERTYFWGDLSHINVSWEVSMVRAGPLTPAVHVAGDGMYAVIDQAYDTVVVPPDVARIYHYSRVGDTGGIARRLNNLDLFFHHPEEFSPLTDYKFGTNNNYESGAAGASIVKYTGAHPPLIREFYEGA